MPEETLLKLKASNVLMLDTTEQRQDKGEAVREVCADFADASRDAANVCLQFNGGFSLAADYDVERKFRETRLYQVAPISTNRILSHVAEHVLGLPCSF